MSTSSSIQEHTYRTYSGEDTSETLARAFITILEGVPGVQKILRGQEDSFRSRASPALETSPARSRASPVRSMASPARSRASPASETSPVRSMASPARSMASPARLRASPARSKASPTEISGLR